MKINTLDKFTICILNYLYVVYIYIHDWFNLSIYTNLTVQINVDICQKTLWNNCEVP